MSKCIHEYVIEDILNDDPKAFEHLMSDKNRLALCWQFGIFFVVLSLFFTQYLYFSIKINQHLPYAGIIGILLLFYISIMWFRQHLMFERFFTIECKKSHLSKVLDVILSGDYDSDLKSRASMIKSDLENGFVDKNYLAKLSLDSKHLESYLDQKY